MTPKEKRRDYHLRRKYGITLGIYAELLKKYDGCCYICRRPASTFKRSLAVDHCHRTQVVRGLLCPFCNRGLRYYGDDPRRFANAAEYLQQDTGYYAPKPKRKRRKTRKGKRGKR